MLAFYVVLYNGIPLQHTIPLIVFAMACYGRKSKFADVGTVVWYCDGTVLGDESNKGIVTAHSEELDRTG